MPTVLVYATRFCPYCMMARRLLQAKGVSWQEVLVDVERERRAEMMQRSGRYTVPQIFVGERHVGGYDDLAALDRAGELEPLLHGA